MPATAYEWMGLSALLWNLALSLFVVLRKPGEALEAVSSRLIAIETQMKHMPTPAEMTQLAVVNERTAGLAQSLDVMRAQLTRMEQYLHAVKR